MKKGDSIFGGIIAGVVMIIIGVCILWYNEGRTVKTQKGINEARDQYVQVKSDKVDSKNEEKLIATNGKLDLSEASELVDDVFNVKAASAKMVREVEMYQWEESCHTDDNNNKQCSYKKDWNDRLIDSSDFQKSGHENPTEMPYESKTYLANNVKLGAFTLPENLIDDLSTKKVKTTNELNEEYANAIEGYQVRGEYVTNQSAEGGPEVGNVRIKFKYNDATSASVLAVQTGNTFSKYVTKYDTKIFRIKEGTHTGKEIIQDLVDENNTLKWILRILGTILVMLGIGSIFSPINKLAGWIPLVGGAVGLVTGLVSILAGLAVSLVVIAIAWFRFRPLLSISLLVIVAICIILLFVLKKKNKNKAEAK